MPTYNSGATLSVALDSILGQTFKNLEVLIIDGVSSDNTIEIAENYKKKYSNINIYSEKDEGIYDAMNKGVAYATGTWLYFMGSDDLFYETTTLETFLSQVVIKTHLVVYGNVYSSRFNGVYDGIFTAAKLAKKKHLPSSYIF